MIDNPKAKRAVEYFTAIRAKCHEIVAAGFEVAAERGVARSEFDRMEEIDRLAREGAEEMK